MAERDRAAVDVDLGGIDPKLAHHGDGLRGEGFVQLEQIDVFHLQTGAIQHLADRRHRSHPHDCRIDTCRRVRQHPRQRLRSDAVSFLARRHHHGRGAVIDPGGVAGRDRAVFLESGFQRRQFFDGCGPRVLVGVDDNRISLFLRHGDRHDFVSKLPINDRPHGAPLALGGKRVLIAARHGVAACNRFCSHAHVTRANRAHEPLVEHRIDHVGVAHPVAPPRAHQQVRRVGHRLGTASDDGVDIADTNRLDGVHHRLQSGSADAVHCFARNVDGQPGLERRLSSHVHPSSCLKDTSHDYVADIRRLHSGTHDRFANDHGREIGSGNARQRAAEGSNRRAARAEDDCVELLVHLKIIRGTIVQPGRPHAHQLQSA